MPRTTAKLWQCPRCERRFAKRNQWHSCRPQPIARHFHGKPLVVRQIYRRLIATLRRLGPLRIDAVQSSINLISTHHFGGLTVRRAHIRLGFLADHAIDDPRIVHRLRLGPARVGHSVLLRSPRDIDAQLLAWLGSAYALQRRPSSRPAT